MSVGIRMSKVRLLEYLNFRCKDVYNEILNTYKIDYEIANQEDVEANDIPQYIINNSIYKKCNSILIFPDNIEIFPVTQDVDESEDYIIGHVLYGGDKKNISTQISNIVEIADDIQNYFRLLGFKEQVQLYMAQVHCIYS